MIVDVLYVVRGGTYGLLSGVSLWDADRDARTCPGDRPVVAHPPCEAWGRMAWSHERKTGNKKGQDGGCFVHALSAVRSGGGCLEHPWGSGAWKAHGISRDGSTDQHGGRLVRIQQGWYGHPCPKDTGIYLVGCDLVLPDDRPDKAGRVQSLSSRSPWRKGTPYPLAKALVDAARSVYG